MMQHSGLENGRWAQLSFKAQMANIGSEVFRMEKWMLKGNTDQAQKALYRALELIDLTLKFGRADEPVALRNSMIYEVCRLREALCYYFYAGSIDDIRGLCKYLDAFAS